MGSFQHHELTRTSVTRDLASVLFYHIMRDLMYGFVVMLPCKLISGEELT